MCLLTVDIKPFRSKIKGKRFAGKESQTYCVKKYSVDINTLITSRNNRKKSAFYYNNAGPPTSIRKRKQISQFRWTYTKVISIEKTQPDYILTMS